MADFFLRFGAADLALGKPGVHALQITATVGDALCMLRDLGLAEISVWDCESNRAKHCESRIRKWECRDCQCIGKVNLLDIVCYYAGEDRAYNIEAASKNPISVLLASNKVRHVDFHSRLTDAFNLILDGAQSLLLPLDSRRSKSMKLHSISRKSSTVVPEKYKRMDFCWITQEDVLRFMLGCIGVFSPIPMITIQDLGIIDHDVMFVDANSKASDALPLIIRASKNMTAVAVVEQEDDHEDQGEDSGHLKIFGDISLASIGNCDETAGLALATLSVADFMTYIQDPANAPHSLKELILSELERKAKKPWSRSYELRKLGLADSFSDSSSISDLTSSASSVSSGIDSLSDSFSDDETESTGSLPGSLPRDRDRVIATSKFHRNSPTSPLCCHPWSSLVAVMAQALAFRSSYVWVTDDENTLIGMVTYLDMIRVLLSRLRS